MPSVTAATSIRRPPPTTRGPSAADLKAAGNLKMVFPRFYGQALPEAKGSKAPQSTIGPNDARVWTAPNGNRLFAVSLGSVRPGALDVPSRQALVDPKTNQFYFLVSGGMPPPSGRPTARFYGPATLPADAQFKSKSFSAADLRALERAASAPPRGPTARQAKAALEAYRQKNLLKWDGMAPARGDALKTIKLSNNNYPDAINTSAVLLRSDPRKVVFVQSGGIAGITRYSQPVDWTRLPK